MNTPDARPKIAISLDRHWAYRLGLDWFTYQRLIRRAGGVPKTLFYDWSPLVPDSTDARSTAGHEFDGLLLGGGIDVDPAHYRSGINLKEPGMRQRRRDQFEMQLIRQAIAVGRPILGICRGCQLLNVALGGSLKILGRNRLHRHVTRCWTHPVSIRRGSRLHQHVGTARIRSVRSLHGEAVDRLGQGVRVVARAPDSTPEAIETGDGELDSNFCIGVQWHPELILSANQDAPLIKSFIEAARRFRERRIHAAT